MMEDHALTDPALQIGRERTTAATALRVGFIGLGDLGAPMARRLIEAGFPTTLWARRAGSLEPFAGLPFGRAATLRELGAASDVVGVCVFADDDVRQVLLRDDGVLPALAPGAVILIHTTAEIPTCREIAGVAEAHGVAVIDAPVSGGRPEAAEGRLTVMMGGEAAAVAKVMPVVEAYGAVIRHMGPLGSGQAIKALNNVTSFCNGRIATLAIETGRQLGLDPQAVMSILRVGGARSRILDSIIDTLLPDPGFRRHAETMVAKDTAVFAKLCRDAGLAPGLLEQLAGEWAGHLVPAIEGDTRPE